MNLSAINSILELVRWKQTYEEMIENIGQQNDEYKTINTGQ